MTHLAVDLALSTTGLCWGTGAHDYDSFTCPTKLRGGERLSWIRRRLREHLRDTKLPRITTLVVEAPFMSRSHPTGAIPLIKLHGAVEHMAWTAGVRYVEVSAATVKAFATGKGNADKEAMIAAAKALGYHVDNDHQADALFIHRWWQQRNRGAA